MGRMSSYDIQSKLKGINDYISRGLFTKDALEAYILTEVFKKQQ